MNALFLFKICALLQFTMVKTKKLNSDMELTIFNGTAAKDAQFPYLGYVNENGQMLCGGSIIHQRWALTAGHCTLTDKNVVFTVGTIFVNGSDGISYGIEQLIAHENFRKNVTGKSPYTPGQRIATYDIALIQLSSNIKFDKNKILPIPLAKDPEDNYDNQVALLAGWGHTHAKSRSSPILLFAKLSVVPLKECKVEFLSQYLTNEFYVCTSSEYQQACGGDSGSPLVLNGEQIGIVAQGDKLCRRSEPTIFTKVSYIVPWIQQTLAKFGDNINNVKKIKTN